MAFLKRIIEVALQKRLPTMFAGPLARRFVERGGLMCCGANGREAWTRTAAHVDKILYSIDSIAFTLTDLSGSWASAADVLSPRFNDSGLQAAAHIYVTKFPANAAND